MKLISIMTPCYNEEENVGELYRQVKAIFAGLPQYRYEHIFIDNASEDRTVAILKEIAKTDKNIKVIVNTRNFGHIRSPYHAFLQTKGDAVIVLVADFQDPPSLIVDFLKKWEEGYQVVMGVKSQSQEMPLMFMLRKMYYYLVSRISDVKLVKNFTGFGLYDRFVLDNIKGIDDLYPYFRGLVSELGFESYQIEYTQLARKRGITKNNFYTLYDNAMLGITNHSKVPLRLAVMSGFLLATLSLLVAIGYFVVKLVLWDSFSIGIAPVVIGLFFFSSVQLFFIGILGEYIGAIHTQVHKRPRVIEKERINFEEDSCLGSVGGTEAD